MIELKTAKYKGVEFLFEDAPTTGGNRIIKFNYPGSDKQAVEVQGKFPRSFNLTAIIPHENYYQERDSLLKVLEDGVPGVLTHPTFGDIPSVINGVYTLTESISQLGRAKITIPFEVDDSSGIPVQSGSVPSQVAQDSLALNQQLGDDLSANYNVSLNFPVNFTDAVGNIENLTESISAVASSAEPIAASSADFRREVNAFAGAIGNLIQTPSDLAETIVLTFESLNNLFETPSELLGAFELLLSFGSDDPEINLNTAGRIERSNNRDLIRATVRGLSLSYAYVAAVQIEYSTTEDLESTQQKLESAYVDLRTNQAISNAALETLDILRVQAQKSFDVALVSTKSIISVFTPLKPLSVLVYEYYGSTDLMDTIADLNGIKQNAFVEGNIRILSL